jgi:hypothetical protein
LSGKRYDGLDFDFNLSSRKRFLKDMVDSGFEVLGVEHYDFRVPFMDILFPGLSVMMGKRMFRDRHHRSWRLFSQGILIKARK